MCFSTLRLAALVAGTALAGEGRAADLPPTGKIDPSLGTKDPKSPVIWYDARRLTLEGKGWADTENAYDRLPARARGKVTENVWNLSKHSAGLCVRFITDSPTINARWTVSAANLAMEHMPATGVSGLDLYVRQKDRWQWAGAGRPRGQTTEASLAGDIPAGKHEYLLYLPLYNGTKTLEIGIPAEAALINPGPRSAKPLCFYGTSIVQGGCASRPGMAHVAILGRKLDVPTLNLGFSGSGKMEPEMAALLGELDVSVYVLDCLPNMITPMMNARLAPFVKQLRLARPNTPIVLVENVVHGNAAFLPGPRRTVAAKNAALHALYEGLQEKGVKHLTYVPGESLLGSDGEGTVDGVHPTDLGFQRFAEALEPALRKITVAAGEG